MGFVVAGGRPDAFREEFMIRDDGGFTATDKEYVTNNALFRYAGSFQVNSVLIHTYQFLG